MPQSLKHFEYRAYIELGGDLARPPLVRMRVKGVAAGGWGGDWFTPSGPMEANRGVRVCVRAARKAPEGDDRQTD